MNGIHIAVKSLKLSQVMDQILSEMKMKTIFFNPAVQHDIYHRINETLD